MNKAVLIGRMVTEPSVKVAQTGNKICSFRIAIDDGWGEKKHTDFLNVTCFGKQAENASQYLHKGSKCGVTGSIKTGSYERQDGSKVNTFEIWANTIDYLDSREEKQEQQFQGFKPVDEDMPF